MVGVNFLAVTGLHAFPVLGELQAEGCPIEAYWADDARIDEHSDVESQQEAQDIAKARVASGWNGFILVVRHSRSSAKCCPNTTLSRRASRLVTWTW